MPTLNKTEISQTRLMTRDTRVIDACGPNNPWVRSKINQMAVDVWDILRSPVHDIVVPPAGTLISGPVIEQARISL